MRMIFAISLSLAVAACGPPDVGMDPSITRPTGDVLPAPSGLGINGEYIYVLRPFDTVSVELAGMPDMQREIRIDGQGMLSFPLAGSVSASGLTTTALALVIEDRLRDGYVRDPRVTVNMVEQQSHILTVDGQVRTPGLFPVTRDMTLMQAVALAGGDTDNSRTSAVMIFREVQGEQYVGLYNLDAIRYGNYPDPRIYPGDKVVVSSDEARQLIGSLQGVTGLITTPLVLLLR
ncbi:MAG: polysaccharide export protein [Erythrobacter sp.]|nr:MAG: polysaccharide export protein [Erythrobacter sp.]